MMLALLLAGMAPETISHAPIEIDHHMVPAFVEYRKCVDERFRREGSDLHSQDEARRAWRSAVASCRAVREVQLEKALAAQAGHRWYGADSKPADMVRRAFDRLDDELNLTWSPAGPDGVEEKPDAEN